MLPRLIYIIILALSSVVASAQSFRIHKGLEVTETRQPIAFAEHAEADYIEVVGATFAMSVTDVTQTTCTLHVTPSNNAVRYYYDVCTRQTLEHDFGGDAARLVEGYIGRLYSQYGSYFTLQEILNETLTEGPGEDELSGLPADTEMAFYAVEVDAQGHCCGTPALTFFTTAPAGDPKDCIFSLDVSHVRSTDCLVSINPSDASVPFWYGISAVSEWPGDYAMTADVSDAIREYASEYGLSISEVASRVVYTGPISMEESGLTPSTAYYAYCYAMDTSTGEPLGAITKVRFETLDYDLSDAQISLIVRYYDADALVSAYPERFSATATALAGHCYMQVSVAPSIDCSNWVVALAKGDLTDLTAYPDETTKNAVLQGGKITQPVNNFVCDWSPCTLLAFGVDAAGVDGPMQRILISPTPSGVSAVETFQANAAAHLAPALPTSPTAQTINNKFNHHYEKDSLYPASRPCSLTDGLGR